ncbi:MAG: hypothetical protein KC423_10525 [Anaerolineales bacterium]|nr:hypothetical protein [Anaerolineales bacterium]
MMTNQDLTQLRQLIEQTFDQGQLRTLCFDLGVAYDDLPGETRPDKVRELIVHCQQHGKLELLVETCARHRPHLAWPGEPLRPLADCPYKGLLYYDVADAPLFFGREKLTEELVNRLFPDAPQVGDNFLAIVGASGSGKSSLVRAGVVAALRQRPEWADGRRIHIITPTAHPLRALARSLTQGAESVRAEATLMDDLMGDKRSLDLYIQRLATSYQPPTTILLVLDQFEELFTLCKDEAERRAFVENVLYAVEEATACPLTVVLTLRADFYHRCADYEGLRQRLERQQRYIGPMDRAELRRAIQQPATAQGLRFEPTLVATMLDEVGEEPGGLPLLSHALQETWRRQRNGELTHVGYRAAGGVKGAIAQTAEATFAALTEQEQAIARNIFLRLTELGEGTEDTRRRVQQAELLPTGDETTATETVVQRLANARLLTTDKDEVEVAHEALIREWETLRGWLDADREGLQIHRRLTRAAQQWDSNEFKRDPDALYRGVRLGQAEAWAAENEGRLNALEQEFLTASQQLRHDLLQEAEARATEQIRINNELRRRSRIQRILLTATTILAVTVFLLFQQASSQRDEAERQGRITLAQSLAALAPSAKQGEDTELATLLAIEAVNINRELMANSEWLQDERLRTLLTETPYSNGVLRGHESGVSSVAFSPNGQTLASGSADQTIRLWNLAQPTAEPTVLRGHEASVNSVAFSPDGQTLASGSSDHTIRLWNLAQPTTEPTILRGHEWRVLSVAFSPDGQTLASASDDQTIRLWNLIQPTAEPTVLRGHEASVNSVAFSPDGQTLASGSSDQTIRLWNFTQPMAEPTVLRTHEGVVLSVTFSPDGRTLASSGSSASFGSIGNDVRLWNLADPAAEPVRLSAHEGGGRSIAFSPDGRTLASGGGSIPFGSAGNDVRLWNLADPAAKPVGLSAHKGGGRSVAFSPTRQHWAVGSDDGTVRLWNLAVPASKPTILRGHEAAVLSVTFSPDGQTLASASADHTVRLWNLADPAAKPTALHRHEDWVQSVAFSPNGQTLASASADHTVHLWNLADPVAEPTVLRGHEAVVLSVTFSPDGQTLASASSDHTVRLWNLDDPAAEPTVLRSHEAFVSSVAFSPDGQTLASASSDHTVRLWNLDDPAAEPTVLRGHEASVLSVAFSPDGQTLASASSDHTVRLWNLADPVAEPTVLRGHEASVFSVAFSPDGKTLASGSADQTVRLWLFLDQLVEIGCREVRRNMTLAEWRRYLPGEPYRQTCPNWPVHPSAVGE